MQLHPIASLKNWLAHFFFFFGFNRPRGLQPSALKLIVSDTLHENHINIQGLVLTSLYLQPTTFLLPLRLSLSLSLSPLTLHSRETATWSSKTATLQSRSQYIFMLLCLAGYWPVICIKNPFCPVCGVRRQGA